MQITNPLLISHRPDTTEMESQPKFMTETVKLSQANRENLVSLVLTILALNIKIKNNKNKQVKLYQTKKQNLEAEKGKY